jgi:hypothetical protein
MVPKGTGKTVVYEQEPSQAVVFVLAVPKPHKCKPHPPDPLIRYPSKFQSMTTRVHSFKERISPESQTSSSLVNKDGTTKGILLSKILINLRIGQIVMWFVFSGMLSS